LRYFAWGGAFLDPATFSFVKSAVSFCNSSLLNSIFATAQFSYKCAILVVPGIGVYSVHVDPPFWDVDPPAKQAIRVRA
jgi:hypothetical protein